MGGERLPIPAAHLEKRYHVQVDCVAGEDLLARIRRGVLTRAGERLSHWNGWHPALGRQE